MKPYVYLTCCVDSTAAKLNPMLAAAVAVTYSKFAKHCDPKECGTLKDYETDPRKGLTLKNDSMVRYFRSWYCGSPCYYVQHSAIEFIWVPRVDLEKLRKAGEKDNYAAHRYESVPAGRVAAGGLAGRGGRWFPQSWRDPKTGEPGGSDRGWAEPL